MRGEGQGGSFSVLPPHLPPALLPSSVFPPSSSLLAGLEYSDLHRDALARNYLLDSLDRSIEQYNDGVLLLTAIRQSTALHGVLFTTQRAALKELLHRYQLVLYAWHQMAELSNSMDLGKAAQSIQVSGRAR